MKVLILAGGFGTRLSEETDIKPKPMVNIGEKPVLWHIMKIYSHFGFNDFVILAGYKSHIIKEYFANYYLINSDVTFDLGKNSVEIHRSAAESWKVTVLDTGMDTMTGGRIKKAKDYINNEPFLLTYGDGVCDVDIREVVKFHKEHGKKATMTAVQPEGRFGILNIHDDNMITKFEEKPKGDGGWINGGFFVCEPSVLDYIEDSSTVFEQKPLMALAARKKVLVTGNTGFKGSWLTLWLKNLGAHVTGFSDRIPTTPSFYKANELDKSITQVWGDVRDINAVTKVIQDVQPDFLFHLAAQALVKESLKNPLDTFATNGMGTANILNALRDVQFDCKAVFNTSDKCYENVEWVWGYKETDRLGGKDPYSASKAVAEIVFHSFYHTYFTNHPYVKIASARAGNVIGGGDWALDRIVPDCVKQWSANEVVNIRRPKSTRPWQHVLEPLGGYLLLGTALASDAKHVHGESFNFGPPANQNYCVEELIKDLAKYWTHADALQLINIDEDKSFYEAGLLKLNTDKALAILGWQPVLNYMETMDLTGEWYNYFYGESIKGEELQQFSKQQVQHYLQTASTKRILWMH
ncbi:MAG: CDP-glucose 4,6-dehydratase [Chitinophagaceae bacterium]|nr:CDP-glucose 4,6-dehydratase [Chitinophagaceae bacterium]